MFPASTLFGYLPVERLLFLQLGGNPDFSSQETERVAEAAEELSRPRNGMSGCEQALVYFRTLISKYVKSEIFMIPHVLALRVDTIKGNTNASSTQKF